MPSKVYGLETKADITFSGSPGCGRFFEGTPAEMDKALNETLGSLPDDTKIFVSPPLFATFLWRVANDH